MRRGDDRAGDRSIARRYELDAMRKCEQPGHAFIGEDWTGEGGRWPGRQQACVLRGHDKFLVLWASQNKWSTHHRYTFFAIKLPTILSTTLYLLINYSRL